MVFFNYVVMCLIFGTTFLSIKIGVDEGLPAFFSAGIRFFLAGVILFVFLCVKKRVHLRLLLHKEMIIMGVCLFGTFSTLYWAEQYVTSGIAAVLSATGPMMILAMQTVFYKKKGSRSAVIGCIIGLSGVAFLVLPGLSSEINIKWAAGCLAVIVGEMFFAYGTIFGKQVSSKFHSTTPFALNAAQMIYGGLLMILLSVFTENIHLEAFQNAAAIGSLVYLIFFGSILGHSLYYWLVARTNPVFPSTWLYISPLIAVVIGVSFYNEYFSWWTGVGVITILIGSLLVNWETLRELLNRKNMLRKGTVVTVEK
ncbi:EamA family transporter [Bacillus sp. NEB1478]|uniref:DMT family transporter n=1 Tax=Bacillus sp. NEB1478 TaxID=3073816 RepID=UPI0028732C08|nr:EamA family transporter [Bacillus sp. NEB1478]WNB91140.1 EamA family transporter [Bacillus sp. NEB1478]